MSFHQSEKKLDLNKYLESNGILITLYFGLQQD